MTDEHNNQPPPTDGLKHLRQAVPTICWHAAQQGHGPGIGVRRFECGRGLPWGCSRCSTDTPLGPTLHQDLVGSLQGQALEADCTKASVQCGRAGRLSSREVRNACISRRSLLESILIYIEVRLILRCFEAQGSQRRLGGRAQSWRLSAGPRGRGMADCMAAVCSMARGDLQIGLIHPSSCGCNGATQPRGQSRHK